MACRYACSQVGTSLISTCECSVIAGLPFACARCYAMGEHLTENQQWTVVKKGLAEPDVLDTRRAFLVVWCAVRSWWLEIGRVPLGTRIWMIWPVERLSTRGARKRLKLGFVCLVGRCACFPVWDWNMSCSRYMTTSLGSCLGLRQERRWDWHAPQIGWFS